MYTWTMDQLKQMLPLPGNPLGEDGPEKGVLFLSQCYRNGTTEEQHFIQHLALFLCTFLKDHGALIEEKVQGGASLKYALSRGSAEGVGSLLLPW